MTPCPACGATGREVIELTRLRAKHRAFAEQTNVLLTEQATEIRILREQADGRTA